LRRRTIEAMLISRRTFSNASAASAISNAEAGAIGGAVILIGDV